MWPSSERCLKTHWQPVKHNHSQKGLPFLVLVIPPTSYWGGPIHISQVKCTQRSQKNVEVKVVLVKETKREEWRGPQPVEKILKAASLLQRAECAEHRPGRPGPDRWTDGQMDTHPQAEGKRCGRGQASTPSGNFHNSQK